MNTRHSKFSEVRLALLAFIISDPWENSFSTAAGELGMFVLYLRKSSTPAVWLRMGNMPCSSYLVVFSLSEDQLSSFFHNLLERRLIVSIVTGLADCDNTSGFGHARN